MDAFCRVCVVILGKLRPFGYSRTAIRPILKRCNGRRFITLGLSEVAQQKQSRFARIEALLGIWIEFLFLLLPRLHFNSFNRGRHSEHGYLEALSNDGTNVVLSAFNVAISLILGGLIDWKGLNAQEPSLPFFHVEEYLHNYSNLIRFGCFYQGTVAIRNDEGSRVLKVKGFYAQDKDQDCVRVDDQVTTALQKCGILESRPVFCRSRTILSFAKGILTQDTAENMRLMERPARFNPIDLRLSPHMVLRWLLAQRCGSLTIFDQNRFYQESLGPIWTSDSIVANRSFTLLLSVLISFVVLLSLSSASRKRKLRSR